MVLTTDSINANENNSVKYENGKRRLTKNEKRRAKEKLKHVVDSNESNNFSKSDASANALSDNITIEYISPSITFDLGNGIDNGLVDQFKSIFSKFTKPEELLSESVQPTGESTTLSTDIKDKNDHTTVTKEESKISKKKLKLASRLSVAELKQLVPRPDVVEAHDVTSSDPRLLVTLKAMKNTVPVPRHWCAKRKYLQGKRGIEKVPFQLPEFIAETGIAKIRESLIEQETLKKNKQKARDRMQPKMGRIDIDYQVLHDAFFKYQTKPKVTIHGDLYYEGKEFEVQVKDAKPGFLSPQLREALGMGENYPPPYLINMQRYGPPPSYPTLKIPGLNAPLPPGAMFGYQSGGWGKPPVDEYGRPLYGDVFGQSKPSDDKYTDAQIDKKTRWGELIVLDKEDEEEEQEEEEEEEEEQAPRKPKKQNESGLETPMMEGISSTTTGLETPSVIDLRKRSGLDTPSSVYAADSAPKDLYKVIQQKQSGGTTSSQIFSSDKSYTINEEKIKEDDEQYGKKKRRLDSSASVQKLKDFKF